MRAWTDLCDWKCSYAAENNFYASFDRSVQLETLFCSWNRFYASLDGSVRQEMLLCYWKQFNVTLDKYMRQVMFLYSWKQFYASLDKSVRQGILFSGKLLAGTPFWIFPPKLEQESAEPFCVVMTHHTAKANLGKGSSWPSEAKIWWGRHTTVLPGPYPVRPTH